MQYPSEQFDQAVADICHGTISADTLEAFTEILSDNPAARREYLWRLEVHGYLGSNYKRLVAATESEEDLTLETTSPLTLSSSDRRNARRRDSASPLSFLTPFLSAAAIILAAFIAVWWSQSEQPQPLAIVGEIAELDGTRWVQSDMVRAVGDKVSIDERIELTAGSASVRFASGAELKLIGPSILQPLSKNSAFLTLGHADVVADSPESKGFTLITPTSRFVDIGTRFSVWATPDGFNRLEVSDGKVDVFSESWTKPKRMSASQSLLIEPGNKQILTTIEAGSNTATFEFPTISAPSADDYADQSQGLASSRVWIGEPHKNQASKILFDGVGTSQADERHHSFFFGMHSEGQVMLDLGKKVSISKVNTYSWFETKNKNLRGQRAKQVYTLYGYLGGPDLDAAPARTPDLPLEESGWVRIARVNSQDTFKRRKPRPFQQVSSITSTDGEIGRYRYLIWHIEGRTTYREFDVYVK